MAVVVGLSAALQQREEQPEANAVAAVVCTPIRPCCWHWPPFIGAAGGGSSAVGCVEGAIVMVVVAMGCRRRCSSGRSSGKPTRWRLRCALIRPCCWH